MTDEKANHPDKTAFGKIHAQAQAAKHVRVIEVPEWGEDKKPLCLYAYPLTINEVIGLDGRFASLAEQNIMQIIGQCMDAQGKPFFSLLDKPALMNEPADIIGRLLVELNGESSTFTEALKKNND